MPDTKNPLLSLSELCRLTAVHLKDAICNECHTCAADISDLNRVMLSELADIERHTAEGICTPHTLHLAHALGECVSRAFSAALLLPSSIPPLPPLVEEATCNAQLAVFPEQLLTTLSELDRFPFYSLHLCANKARGAHAMLLNNYIATDGGKWLLPLSYALEAHRNVLERTCGLLMERT
ncbi:MAG: hypothetical protein IJZ80_08500 [Clostridia bacterium]|nr:hypothetical protein [Clostridia bacterium]